MCLIVGQTSSKLKFCLGFSQKLSSNVQTGSAVIDMIDIVDNDITVKMDYGFALCTLSYYPS